jgi:hypothetical protein
VVEGQGLKAVHENVPAAVGTAATRKLESSIKDRNTPIIDLFFIDFSFLLKEYLRFHIYGNGLLINRI